jgi:predicted nucleic acid-binding protein
MFLLDTNVICEMSKKRPAESVMRWIKRQNEIALGLQSVTISTTTTTVFSTTR